MNGSGFFTSLTRSLEMYTDSIKGCSGASIAVHYAHIATNMKRTIIARVIPTHNFCAFIRFAQTVRALFAGGFIDGKILGYEFVYGLAEDL